MQGPECPVIAAEAKLIGLRPLPLSTRAWAYIREVIKVLFPACGCNQNPAGLPILGHLPR
jgi:hypothetical protein